MTTILIPSAFGLGGHLDELDLICRRGAEDVERQRVL